MRSVRTTAEGKVMGDIFNPQIFREAAAVTKMLRSGADVQDISSVERAAKHLDAFGVHLDDFAHASVVDRTLLWIGAQAATKKKARTDEILFSTIREMSGVMRDIRSANGKLERADDFLQEISANVQ